MNWDRIEDRWEDVKGSARAHWGKLTDEDWKKLTGEKGALLTSIQERYAIAREEAERQADEWSNALPDPERQIHMVGRRRF